jgi:signal transduction histidine kinase/AmiR/NasT family two-component response regulator/HPt (histidine-containing phosphotransfer) domain-containing protein
MNFKDSAARRFRVPQVLCIPLFLCIPLIFACRAKEAPRLSEHNAPSRFVSYRDIPGITREEIGAIEAFRTSGRVFRYGMTPSPECFEDKNGLGGFSVLFCRLLSDMFGIEFVPALYNWDDLVAGLESGGIDFSGEFTATPQRRERYLMTGPIAEHAVTITRRADAPGFSALGKERRLRIAFLPGNITRQVLFPVVNFEFDSVIVASREDARAMLRSGTLDAFLEEGFERHETADGLESGPFLPLVNNPVSLTTANPELAPVIFIVQKYLDGGALPDLFRLYREGRGQYLSHLFLASLNAEESAWLEHAGRQPVPVLMEADNYPVAFYNQTEQEWQGIAPDILREISAITGLLFQTANRKEDSWSGNLARLEDGTAAMISELIKTDGREGRFLWAEVPYMRDQYALLSKADYPDLEINEIQNSRVALIKQSAYREMFRRWFPRHPDTVEYDNKEDALAALEKGAVDMVMGSQAILLSLTNYHDKPGFKINHTFNSGFDSMFGYNLGEGTLRSIVDKAQRLVNLDHITGNWLSRVFDYRLKMIRLRETYLIIFSAIMGWIMVNLALLLYSYKKTGKRLEAVIKKRTGELEKRTRELELQKEAVQAAYKVKSRFLANMSHDLRTPLNAIIGLSETELKKAPPASQDTKTNLVSINRAGLELLSVINDLLDISNIESGNMELCSTEYSFADFMNGVSAFAMFCIGEKPLRFALELDQDLPARLYGDEQRVRQILHNLLSNAVKFTTSGNVTLSIHREKTSGFAGGRGEPLLLTFEVSDTGVGISDRDMETLFSDYSQADSSSSRGGTGMGLLITKKLAEMMCGGITARSEAGKGSVFTAVVRQNGMGRLDKAVLERLTNFTYTPEDAAEAEKVYLPYARVLVVDDVTTNLAVARGIMRPYGLTVDTVDSGIEAIDVIRKGSVRYDAVFMDHMMPEMDGIEAVRIIREDLGGDYAGTVPIIALTANALPGNEELFLSHGFNAYITKPIKTEALEKVLLQWVRNEQKEKAWNGNPAAAQKTFPEMPGGRTLLAGAAVEGVDLASGAAQFGGEEAYLEIVKVFIDETPKLLENIKDMSAVAQDAADALKNYSIALHGLKGSCYGICAAEIGGRAEELEHAAQAGDFRRISELNAPFIQAAQTLLENLGALFEKAGPKPPRDAPDTTVLEHLHAAAKSYNTSAMLTAFKELDAYRYETGGELVEALREAVKDYDYPGAVRLLEQ